MLERLVQALFGKKPEPVRDEGEERTFDAYYERMLRIKGEVLSDEKILNNIRNAFESTYLGEECLEDVLFLGCGSTHTVLHVGEVVDPENNKPVHLAVRLKDDSSLPYAGCYTGLLHPQLYAFEQAFVDGNNPPYFVGVVSWQGPEVEFEEERRIFGFLLEDVSERGEYELVEEGQGFFIRIERGENTRYFLDPLIGDPMYDSKYLSDEARIDVN